MRAQNISDASNLFTAYIAPLFYSAMRDEAFFIEFLTELNRKLSQPSAKNYLREWIDLTLSFPTPHSPFTSPSTPILQNPPQTFVSAVQLYLKVLETMHVTLEKDYQALIERNRYITTALEQLTQWDSLLIQDLCFNLDCVLMSLTITVPGFPFADNLMGIRHRIAFCGKHQDSFDTQLAEVFLSCVDDFRNIEPILQHIEQERKALLREKNTLSGVNRLLRGASSGLDFVIQAAHYHHDSNFFEPPEYNRPAFENFQETSALIEEFDDLFELISTNLLDFIMTQPPDISRVHLPRHMAEVTDTKILSHKISWFAAHNTSPESYELFLRFIAWTHPAVYARVPRRPRLIQSCFGPPPLPVKQPNGQALFSATDAEPPPPYDAEHLQLST